MVKLEYTELLSDIAPIMMPLLVILALTLIFRNVIYSKLNTKTAKFNLTILVAVQLSGAIFIGFIAEFYMARIGSEVVEIAEIDIPLTNKVSEMEIAQMHQIIWFERSVLAALEGDAGLLEKNKANSLSYNGKIADIFQKTGAVFANASELAHNDVSRTKFRDLEKQFVLIKEHYQDFNVQMGNILNNLVAGQKPNMEEVHSLEKVEDDLAEEVESYLLDIEQFTLKSALKAEKDEKLAEIKIFLVLVLTFLCSLSFTSIVMKVLTLSLSSASENLVTVTDELSQLTSGISNTSIELEKVSNSSRNSLHETTGSMTEITSINDNNFGLLRGMQQTQKKVENAVRDARSDISNLLGSINEIKTANRDLSKIQEIIKRIDDETDVINSIVFKTQLLSVNASIEASSAGEYGKGFAVVADEVSKLASLSGESAEQIDELIGESSKQVGNLLKNIDARIERGVKAAESVSKVFDEIRKDLDEMTVQNEQVFSSAKEQNIGITRIRSSLESLQEISEKEHEVSKHVLGFSKSLVDSQDTLESASNKVVKLVANR